MEQRIIELETRLGFQEYTLEQLNQVVVEQQRALDELARRLERAEDRLKALQASNIALPQEETPPPHY